MKKWMIGILVCLLLFVGAGALAQQMESMEFEEGTYFGYLTDGQPDGFGIYSFHDGGLHYGMFKDGVFSGYGCRIYPEGEASSIKLMGGFFEEGHINGEGVILYHDGRRLEGQFTNGLVVPDETQRSKDEYILYDGTPNQSDPNAAIYIGEVLAASPEVPHGYGMFSFPPLDSEGSDHPAFFVGKSVAGIGEDGVFVDVFLDTYWVTVFTDGQVGETIDMGN
jgi:hypothetical protein